MQPGRAMFSMPSCSCGKWSVADMPSCWKVSPFRRSRLLSPTSPHSRPALKPSIFMAASSMPMGSRLTSPKSWPNISITGRMAGKPWFFQEKTMAISSARIFKSSSRLLDELPKIAFICPARTSGIVRRPKKRICGSLKSWQALWEPKCGWMLHCLPSGRAALKRAVSCMKCCMQTSVSRTSALQAPRKSLSFPHCTPSMPKMALLRVSGSRWVRNLLEHSVSSLASVCGLRH